MNSEGNPKQPATVRVKPMRLVQFSDKIGGVIADGWGISPSKKGGIA